MQVKTFGGDPMEARQWDEFVARNEQATSDHLWGWRRILSESFGYRPIYLGAIEGDRLTGILPLFLIPRGFRRVALSSIPFGNYGGICADSKEAALALLHEAKELLHREKADYLELRHQVPLPDKTLQPQRLYNRFRLPLTGDPEIHFRQLNSTSRKRITRSVHTGLRLVVSRDVGLLYPIHLHTFRRLGSPCFPRRYFELILEEFPGSTEIYFVVFQNLHIAYHLNLFFKNSLVSQLGGSLAHFQKHNPMYFLYWCEIQEGCARGLKELDRCRSRPDSGSAEHKRWLRMVEEPLGYQYYLPNGNGLPQRNPSNPKYQWLIRTWQHLPIPLTQLIGPRVVRYLA